MTRPQPDEILVDVLPFVGTLGYAELEHAAAVIVFLCQREGAWVAATEKMVDKHQHVEPLATWVGSPFFKPDLLALVAAGYATRTQDPGGVGFALTDAVFEKLERYIRRKDAR